MQGAASIMLAAILPPLSALASARPFWRVQSTLYPKRMSWVYSADFLAAPPEAFEVPALIEHRIGSIEVLPGMKGDTLAREILERMVRDDVERNRGRWEAVQHWPSGEWQRVGMH